MVNPNRFYTYAYLREDKTPYYIGKGKEDRAFIKNRKGIRPPNDKCKILILKQNLTEEEAFNHEKYMIAVFGRKDLGTGILHNRTDGGEGPSGVIKSEETRRKLSEANKGEKSHMYGKSLSQETKRKLSELNTGENNPNYGKSHSQETKRKMSEARKGKNVGRKWWNDGCGNTVFAVECPPNYYKGRGKLHLETNRTEHRTTSKTFWG